MAGFRVPALGPRPVGALRRAHPGPAGAVLRANRRGGASWRTAAPSSTSPRARSTTRTWAGSCCVTTRALAHDDLLVVATTGGPDPEPLRRGLPANVRLERFVPHDLLLPHVDVMVTNGGYGGVQQALANGVPLVVAGDSEDKPEVAARVQWSGAGINLHTGRPSPAMVARAVRRVLARAVLPPPGPRAAGRDRRDRPARHHQRRVGRVVHGQRRRTPGRGRLSRPPGGAVTVGGMQAESRSGRLRWPKGSKPPPFPTRSPTRDCSRISRPASCTAGCSTSSSAGSPPRTTRSWPSSSTARRARASSWSG